MGGSIRAVSDIRRCHALSDEFGCSVQEIRWGRRVRAPDVMDRIEVNDVIEKLDKAALDILRRASPFDPFPPEVRADYDRLRFAYKWVFSEELENATAAATQN